MYHSWEQKLKAIWIYVFNSFRCYLILTGPVISLWGVISTSIVKNLSNDSHHSTHKQKQKQKTKTGNHQNVQPWKEENEAANSLGNRIKRGGEGLGGKDKFGLEHAEFEVLMGHQVVASSERQEWRPGAWAIWRPERKRWDRLDSERITRSRKPCSSMRVKVTEERDLWTRLTPKSMYQ